uniref:EamA family transporter n=1 Tax=Eiseniibacteriota bacterium TaxID=2212470 RepID=A0A832I6B3_UNCEI
MKAMWLAILAGACWGVGEVCTKMVLHTHRVGPVTAIAVRATVALPVLWVAALAATHGLGLEPRHGWRTMPPGDVLRLVLGSGLVAGAAGMILFYAALNLDDISRVKPVAFTVAPAVAVLLGWLLLREPMTARKAVALAMILAGVGLLSGAPAQREGAAGAAAPRAAPPMAEVGRGADSP